MKRVSGYITVYLSLVLGIIISLIVTMIEGVRIQTCRFETECVMDAGLNSIFAEYHREMLNKYGLLFIDNSYGTSEGNAEHTKDHLMYYMNLNFKREPYVKNLTALHADNAILSNISYASDNKGEVLRYQIVQYMKIKSGLDLISNQNFVTYDMEAMLDKYDSYEEERDAISGEISELVQQHNEAVPEEEQIDISNPADAVEKLSQSNALYYAFGDTGRLSCNTADISALISSRTYTEGVGLYANQSTPYGVINNQLFYTYLFDKCGFYGSEKENTKLKYEIEYILSEKDGDIENLEAVVEKIFKIRYGVNIMYLMTDAAKKAEALELAVAVTALLGMPEVAVKAQKLILLAWAYAESAKDLRILFSGHKLSLVKTAGEWSTPLSELVNFKAYLDSYVVPNGSMEYKDFLYAFILMETQEELNMKIMDIMEMDIRLTPGNANFKMNNQIYQLIAEVNVSSKYGPAHSIKRGYSYW